MLERFVETLINALAVGSLYALIALGYTMVYGILKFINFAHSDVFVLGAWIAFAAAGAAGWSASGAQTEISAWIVWVLIAVPVLSGAVWAFDYGLRPALGENARVRLPRLGQTATLSLISVWGWLILGLVVLARGLKTQDWLQRLVGETGFQLIVGGVILLIAMLACGVVGFALERMAYKPLRKAPRLNVLITAIGVSLLLQNLGQLSWMFGTSPQRMPALLPDIVIAGVVNPLSDYRAALGLVIAGVLCSLMGRTPVQRVLWFVVPTALWLAAKYIVEGVGVSLRLIDVIGFLTALVLMLALDWLVFRTKVGRAMRAVSFSPETASLMGIPVDRIISFTFVLGAMLAAAAGFLFGQKYPGINQPASAGWVLLGLKAFVAAVVGGIGNIRGAMLGGILIGCLEMFGATYTSPNLRDLYVFGVLILVLLFKPSGLLGSSAAEKV